MKKVIAWLNQHEWLVLILILVAVLRIPGLFEPNRYADEDIYLTLGQAWRRGWVFYRDIHDNKPPLLYLVAGLAGSVMWLRLILMIWNLVNVWLVWELATKLVRRSFMVIGISAVFGVLSTLPLLEGNIANGEIFMIMPVTAAVLLIYTNQAYLWAGLLFAAGFLFKVPVVFDLLGIGIWLLLYRLKEWRQWWLLGVGFLAPILVSIGYYWIVGAGEPYLRSALGQNIGYLSSWEGEGQPVYQSGLFIRGVMMLIALGSIAFWRKRLGPEMAFASLWFVGALFGAFLSGRPYPHYLIEILVPGALLLGVAITSRDWFKWLVGAVLLGLVGLGVWQYRFWYYQSWPYYENFFRYLVNRDWLVYRDFWGEGVVRNHRVAEYIRQRSGDEDRIFVWGTEPAIYFLSRRLPAGRYTVAYHIRDFNGWGETMGAIRKEEPKFVVTMEYEGKFDELESYLAAKYVEVEKIQEARIFRRLR